jgi:hypothetical protein
MRAKLLATQLHLHCSMTESEMICQDRVYKLSI